MPTRSVRIPYPAGDSREGRHNHQVGIIRVDAKHRERKGRTQVDQGCEYPLLGLVPHCLRFGPTGEDVCDGEGLGELAAAVTALVADQVDLHEPRRLSSQSAQVRIEICDFNRDPGLVPERPLSSRRLRSPASRRSIVAADIAHNFAAVAYGTSSS